jgi:transcription elongation factor Elf1
MKHLHENNIKCPYCDYEDIDSWEFDDDSGSWTCGSCEKEFDVVRNIEVTYSSYRKSCENENHDWKFKTSFVSKRDFKKGKWIDREEYQWTFHKVFKCSICGEEKYIEISKEEYEQRNIEGNRAKEVFE